MLYTLAAVVFCATIFVFFSQEFVNLFKKILAIPGAKLILPLALASWLVYHAYPWILRPIYRYKILLNTLVDFFSSMLPLGRLSLYMSTILVLTVLSVLPVFLLDLFFIKKTYKSYPYPYLTSTFLWLISSLTLVILQYP